MFIHNLKYSFKTLLKNKMLIFWTFAFPIILGTFFKMAFSNIENSEKLDIIDIAIVENDEFKNNEIFKETFKELSDDSNEEKLFNIKYVDEEKAKELLKDDEIVGYLIIKDEPNIIVNTSGIDETIFKYVTEEITQTENMIENIVPIKVEEKVEDIVEGKVEFSSYEEIYKKIYDEIIDMLENNNANILDISNSNLSYTMIEFYTLIAMACLYGGILGLVAINQNLPNMSNNGKRVAMSPTPKYKVILSSVIASYVVQLIGIALLFVYTIFVLKVDYGTNLPLIILLACIGCLAGLSMGVAIASVFKTNDNLKTGIVISVTMLWCFLSGMMGVTMKYIVDKNIPIINKLNPASMITDGFYSLYYYNTLDRFWFNVISLLAFASLMIVISMISLRRQKYDNI